MRGWGVTYLGVALAVVACGQPQPDPKRAPVLGPSLPRPAPVRPAAQYAPSEALLQKSLALAPTAASPDGGVIVSGLRVSARGEQSRDVAPLSGGARVPPHLGGGFLFWGSRALYAAKTFTAPLQPVFSLPTPPKKVSFGLGWALVHLADGARVAVELPSRRRAPMPVAGLADGAALVDGRAALLVDPGLVLTLAAGTKTWKDLSARASGASELVADETEIWIRHTSGRAYRLERDGNLSELSELPARLARRQRRAEWSSSWPPSVAESPRERALRRGHPLDARTAVVEAAGLFARVDLESGEVRAVTPSVLAAGATCELVPVTADVVAICTGANGVSVLVAGATGERPHIEKVFPTDAPFYVGAEGALAHGGPCSDAADASRAVVCVRQPNGLWRQLGESRPFDSADPWADAGPDAGPTTRNVARWVPTREGSALGLVLGPGGGILDASRGTFTPFRNDGHTKLGSLTATAKPGVYDELAADADGSIYGYAGRQALRLAPDGSVTFAPHVFESLANAGEKALATDRDGRLWQSLDHGRTWAEVARPPGQRGKARTSVGRCSRVGCDLGDWYRIGFAASPPVTETTEEAPPVPVLPTASRPRLSCERTASPSTRFSSRARGADGEPVEALELGLRKSRIAPGQEPGPLGFYLRDGELVLRAATLLEPSVMDETSPGFFRALGTPRLLRFVEPIGESRVHETRFSWQELLRAAGSATGTAPNPPRTDERSAVPVFGVKPGVSEGLVLNDPSGALLWVRAGKPARVLALGPENADLRPRAALARDKGELVVLAVSDQCAARVLSFQAGALPRTLAALPPRPSPGGCPPSDDALALAPDGSVAVLRLPSLDAPSEDDPAVVLRAGQHPAVLAPWSKLVPLESCPSDPDAIRTLIMASAPWLDLALPGVDDPGGDFMLALVRWSKTSACLEAVELQSGSLVIGEQELQTTVLSRFGAAPLATRRGVGFGIEHAEALACKLSPAPSP